MATEKRESGMHSPDPPRVHASDMPYPYFVLCTQIVEAKRMALLKPEVVEQNPLLLLLPPRPNLMRQPLRGPSSKTTWGSSITWGRTTNEHTQNSGLFRGDGNGDGGDRPELKRSYRTVVIYQISREL